MDEKPDQLEREIARTRGTLDRDLRRLGDRIDALKERAIAQAQWWAGIGAVAMGVAGAIVFWPRRA
ncbi:MAG TPA: DUF3618 domain-containing protein [Vicinamibacterales bacterium]|nr:DUF3618 domain-containing protein [Vicinamibacterales bacterium]